MNKKVIVLLLCGVLPCIYLGVVQAQQGNYARSSGVRTSLSFVPFDPIGEKLRSIVQSRLAASNVVSLLPESPDSIMKARFEVRIDSKAIGVQGEGCGPLAVRDTHKTSATAVSFIYVTHCGSGRGRADVAGSGLIVCTKEDVEKCADRIVRAAESNAGVTDQYCGG